VEVAANSFDKEVNDSQLRCNQCRSPNTIIAAGDIYNTRIFSDLICLRYMRGNTFDISLTDRIKRAPTNKAQRRPCRTQESPPKNTGPTSMPVYATIVSALIWLEGVMPTIFSFPCKQMEWNGRSVIQYPQRYISEL
jgi:hypothetical protein